MIAKARVNGRDRHLRGSCAVPRIGGPGFALATLVSLLGITTPLQAAPRCRYFSPELTGNLLLGVAYGNGRYVAVGRNKTVVISGDGVEWRSFGRSVHANEASVAFGGGLFVAAWGSDSFEVSTNGEIWRSIPSPGGSYVYSVAYGGGKFVAIGSGRRIWTSWDGLDWSLESATLPSPFRSIEFVNGQFIGTQSYPYDSYAMGYSPDGLSWTSRSICYGVSGCPDNTRVVQVTWGEGLWVATLSVSSPEQVGGLAYSPDLATWTVVRPSPQLRPLGGVAHVNGRFVALGWADHVTSEDGMSWEIRPEAPWADTSIYSAATLNGQVFGVGTSGSIRSSGDGIAFLDHSPRKFARGSMFGRVGTTLYAAVSQVADTIMSSKDIFASGDNGANWSSLGNALASRELRWTGGRIYGTTDFHTSADGVTWSTPGSSPYTMAYGAGKYVAVGGGTTWISSDGVGFTEVIPSPTTNSLIAFGNGLFVAAGVSSGDSLWFSPNGINWTEQPQPASRRFAALAFGNGTFVASLYEGSYRVTTSTNGSTWTPPAATPTPGGLQRVAFLGELFFAFSYNFGGFWASSDGVSWIAMEKPSWNDPAPIWGIPLAGGKALIPAWNGPLDFSVLECPAKVSDLASFFADDFEDGYLGNWSTGIP